MTDELLTKRKAKWAKGRNVVLKGKKLNYNASQQEKYKYELRRLTIMMIDETKKSLIRFFHGDDALEYFKDQKEVAAMDASVSSQARILLNFLNRKFSKLFSLRAKPLAEKMVNGAAASSKTALHSSLEQLSGGLSLTTGVVPAGMEQVAAATVAENVSLIKSIPSQFFKDITGAVMRSITTGEGVKSLIPDIQKYSGQTERRVKNLALDQTRKAYNSINKQRLMKIGVKQFKWIHSYGGQKPRDSHIKISGKIFSFENLEAEQAALGVPEADRGIPGQAINCRCTMNPVIEFNDE